MPEPVKLLNAEQVAAFDVEYIDDSLFQHFNKAVNEFIKSPENLHLLDVGGGNGSYADRFLEHYAGSQVTIVEPDEAMLGKNNVHPNKHLRHGIFQKFNNSETFDLIQFNWVLHHFVTSGYSSTHQLQRQGLLDAYDMLAPGGLIIIFENFYEGKNDSNTPGKHIFHLTASKWLKKLTRRLGANTAGVGVCFNSAYHWQQQLQDVGFEVVHTSHCYNFGNLSLWKKCLLGIKRQRVGLLVGQKQIS
ncbi:class I SAM-dependent methyltransferase [Endozoicomonas ascidiicola]|uniref:class I SAM-dependent methyltransferase n=1 Tax=Endozoicomonas ascidiicola TaxID=1698521 RepID=UPI00082BBB1C|nr:class I SAM-dependent methyltransferase [Endozoicomonas ascidiicola]